LNYQVIHTSHLPVPVKVYVEHRNNSRVSLASSSIIIRLPAHISAEDKNRRVNEHIEWARMQLEKKDHYRHIATSAGDYQNKSLRLCEIEFKIELFSGEASRSKLNYKHDQVIRIFISKALPEKQASKEIRRLLIKFAEKYFSAKITERTHSFNQIYFGEKIGTVRLNHTVSKWGSCSAQKNIMFSTKLLLLPLAVIDYVIVHELAHLKEMNHSEKYWREVARVMPDYKKWDRWLTRHGSAYHF
jgi:predicted metal-dependent hydrolase